MPLPPGYRSRLIEGMLEAAAEKGYMATSVMDIVRHAKVSKRTFYECFEDKEQCFLEAYAAVSNELLARVGLGATRGDSAEEKLTFAIQAYFLALSDYRRFLRSFLSEVHAAGPRALALRRTILQRFADFLRLMVDAVRVTRPDVRALSQDMAMALIGGVHELLLSTLEQGRIEELPKVGETAYELIASVVKVEPT